jgi:hypothetical protein
MLWKKNEKRFCDVPILVSSFRVLNFFFFTEFTQGANTKILYEIMEH